MLNVSKPSADRVDIQLSGALDAQAMRAALDELIEESEGVRHGKMLYEISDFEMPTLSAMAVEMVRMPRLLSLINRFDRCAVVSDAAWIRTAAEIEGAVFPSLEIKAFAPGDTKAAEAWLESDAMADTDAADAENFPV